MSMIGMGIFPFLFYYLYAVVPLAPLVYLFIKWRAYRNGHPTDPWLGAVVLLHYFWTLALHLALFGLSLALAGLIKGPNSEELKLGLGLLSAGVIALLVTFFALSRVPSSPQRPQTWRVFNALNLLFCGLVALVALCAAAIMLFDGKSADAPLPLVALILFGAAWSWFLRLMIFKVKKSG
jgi:multisubunit Na+/H+ antiporter MnhF subunit